MASYENIADQENMAPFAGGRRAAKGVMEQKIPFGQTRSVLGNLSTNNLGHNSRRAQPKRAAKDQIGGGFSIFCDDENSAPTKSLAQPPAALLSRQVASSRLPLVDKENQGLPVPSKTFKIHADARPARQPLVEDIRVRHDSSRMEEEEEQIEEEDVLSPMLLDTSHQEWRVPPLSSDGETVDIFTVPEYSQDIYRYLRGSETKFLPKWNYMSKQPDITHSMRAILVDWLVEVAEEYKLQTETLYLAVSYIDRFLSYMSVQRAKLQLVGTACMFIAAKYEEIYPPDVGEFVYITDDTYNKRQVLRMEHLVLKVLNFDLSVPSSHLFVSQISDMLSCDERTQHLAMYLNELSLMAGERFLMYSPSLVAAASVALARHTVLEVEDAWPVNMAQAVGYSTEQLQECLLALHSIHTAAEGSPQQAVREKYRASKYHAVSEIQPATMSNE